MRLTNVETVSSVQRKLLIALSGDDLKPYRERVTKRVTQQAKIPGFRPGKAPRSYVEAQFGSVILQDTMQEAVRGSLPKAIEEAKLTTVGYPDVQVQKFDDSALEFSATVEIYPEVKLIKDKGFSLEAPAANVTQIEIEEEIESVRSQHATLEPVTEARPVRGGDTAIVDFHGTVDGQDFAGNRGDNFPVEIGSKGFFDGFEDGIKGHKVGEEFVIPVQIPAEVKEPAIAGKTAQFKIKIHEIKQKVLPELSSEFFEKVKQKDLESWKQQIQQRLATTKKNNRQSALKDKLLAALIEANPFEVPQAMLKNQQASLAERGISQLRQSYPNINDETIKQILGGWQKDIEKDAERLVRSWLILDQVGKDRKVEVTDADLEAKFAELATSYQQTPDQIKDYYTRRNPKALDSLKAQIREDKIIDSLLAGCKISEV